MECRNDVAFQELKQYLSKPPSLTSLHEGETLFMCLVAPDFIVNTAFIVERNRVQYHVYCVSKVLHDAKTWYFARENGVSVGYNL